MNADSKVIKKNILYNSVGNFIYLVCQWALSVVVVKFSSYDNAGVLALAMSLTSTLYAISSFGMRNYQSSDLDNKYFPSEYFFSRIVTNVISFLICIVFICLNNYNYYTKFCIIIYMLFRIGEAFVDVLHGEEQKKWRLDIAGISFAIRGIISIILFALVLSISKSLIFALLAIFISTFAVIYFYDYHNYKMIIGKITKVDTDRVKKLLIICMPLAIYSLFANVIQFFPKYALEREFGEKVLGIYSSIASPVMVVQVAATYIFNPLITLFAEYYNQKQKDKFWKLFIKVAIIILIIGIVGVIGIFFCGNFGLRLLYNEELLKYSYLLYQILFTVLLTAYVWFMCSVLTITRSFKILIVSVCMATIINIVLSLIVIPNYGLTGVTIVLIVSLLTQIVISFGLEYFVIKKHFDIKEEENDIKDKK